MLNESLVDQRMRYAVSLGVFVRCFNYGLRSMHLSKTLVQNNRTVFFPLMKVSVVGTFSSNGQAESCAAYCSMYVSMRSVLKCSHVCMIHSTG